MTGRLPTLLALLALAVGAVACGGGEEQPQAVAAGAPATTPAGEVGEAVTAEADEGGAEEEAPPDLGELDDLPEEGVGSGQTQCPAAPSEVTRAAARAVRESIVCLVNAERTSRGLKPLKVNSKLQRAATGKAADMVRRRYFSHDTPDGKKFTVRVRQSGYMSRARKWSVGENLGWGAGSAAGPDWLIGAWLKSPSHRANMLSRKWVEVGVGLSLGTPGGEDGVTYAAEFGKLG